MLCCNKHMDIHQALQPTTPKALKTWLEKHYINTPPLWIVIYKKSSGKQGVTYDDVLAEAICFGLIDAKTKTVSDEQYGIALYPRKPGGNWTDANVALAKQLIAKGRMTPAGLQAFQQHIRADT